MCAHKLQRTPAREFAEELRRPLGVSTPVANKVVVHLCGPQSPIAKLREVNGHRDLSLWLFGKCEKDACDAALRLFSSLARATAAFRTHPDFERWRSVEEEFDRETTQGAFLAARLSGLCAAEHSAVDLFESHDEAVELSTWTDAHWPCVAGGHAIRLPIVRSTLGLPSFHPDMCCSLGIDDRWWSDCSRLGNIDGSSSRKRQPGDKQRENEPAASHFDVLGIFRKCMGKRCQIRELIPHIHQKIMKNDFLRHCFVCWLSCSIFGYYADSGRCAYPWMRLKLWKSLSSATLDVSSLVDSAWLNTENRPGHRSIYLAVREAMSFYVAQEPALRRMLELKCDWVKFEAQNNLLRQDKLMHLSLEATSSAPAANMVVQSMNHSNLDHFAFTELLWSYMQRCIPLAMSKQVDLTIGSFEERQCAMWTEASLALNRLHVGGLQCDKTHVELVGLFMREEGIVGTDIGAYLLELYQQRVNYGKTEMQRRIKNSLEMKTFWQALKVVWMLRTSKRLVISPLSDACKEEQLRNVPINGVVRKLVCGHCVSEEAIKCCVVNGQGDPRVCSKVQRYALATRQKAKKTHSAQGRVGEKKQPVYGAKGVALCTEHGTCVCCPRKTCPSFMRALPTSDRRFATTLPSFLLQARCSYSSLHDIDMLGKILHLPEFSMVLCCFCLRPMLYNRVPSMKRGTHCCAICMRSEPSYHNRSCAYCHSLLPANREMCKTVLVCDDGDPLRPRLKWASLCPRHAHSQVHNRTWTIPHSLLRFLIEGKVFERALSNGATVIVRRLGTNKLNGSSEAVHLRAARSYAIM